LALCSHHSKDKSIDGRTSIRSVLQSGAIPLLLFGAMAMFTVACLVDSFSFQFEGAGAMFFNWVHPVTSEPIHNFRSFSLITVGTMFPKSLGPAVTPYIYFIVVVYYLFAIVCAFAHLIALSILWFAPLTLTFQRRLFVLTEILNAWSAPDVFVICIIASLLQLPQFAAFIIGDRCDFINRILRDRNIFDPKYYHYEPVCFEVKTELLKGSWLLIGGSIAYLITAAVVMRKCHRVLRERQTELRTPVSE